MALTNYTMMDIFNMLIAPAFIDTIKGYIKFFL